MSYTPDSRSVSDVEVFAKTFDVAYMVDWYHTTLRNRVGFELLSGRESDSSFIGTYTPPKQIAGIHSYQVQVRITNSIPGISKGIP